MRIKPPTLGEKIAMTITNDNAPIADASTLVARLEEHADFSNKVMRDLLLEASDRIQFLTKERDYYELKMTFPFSRSSLFFHIHSYYNTFE